MNNSERCRLLWLGSVEPMRNSRSVITFLVGFFAIVNIVSVAAENQVPFVPGFERFGRHDDVEEALAGEVLLSELSCTACHASERISAKGGPQLDGIARRVSEEWLRDFLASPATVQPGTTMPDVLSGLTQQSKEQTIAALVAFLSTLHAEYPAIKAGGTNPVEFEFWKQGDASRGVNLYHQTGCVACHAADADYKVAEIAVSPVDQLLDELDPDVLADMGLASSTRRVESIPHGDLASKYSRLSLTRFLFQPEHFRPGGRMPNMKLALSEAADIAAYLLQRRNPLLDRAQDSRVTDDRAVPRSTDAVLIETGRQLFATLGCANCHHTGAVNGQSYQSLEELDLDTVSASCLNAGTGHATYGLDPVQTAAIKAAIVGLKSPSPVNGSKSEIIAAVDRTLLQMNCYGCHTRDNLGGIGRDRKGYFQTVEGVDLGDEGRLPPSLSGVGRKLKPSWLKRVFRGDATTTLRPHMTVRMPKFPHADVTSLADRLGVVDGANPAPASEVFVTSATGAESSPNGKIGHQLMEIGCTECHEFGGQAMPGVIGVDLIGVPDRIFPAWFRDFVMNPGELKTRTRMPNFFPEGQSQLPQVLGGDASKQIAAMWDYLEHHEQFGIPSKIAAQRAKNYQLAPTDHPIILRTFMNGVGTHAIAIGFPAGVHFAMDARQARLAIGWRKNFVDAQSTWFERFAPPIDPLDPGAQPIGEGPSFFTIDSRDGVPTAVTTEFLGYQLDRDRIPTFRYLCGGYRIEDRIVPNGDGGLRRRIRLVADGTGVTSKLWFRVIEGDHVSQETEHQFRSESGLSVQLLNPQQSPVHRKQWMIPLRVSDDLELIYQWP